MRILILTDAWFPQVSGVVRTLDATIRSLEGMGHEVHVVEPGGFSTVPCPTYPQIRLALCGPGAIARRIGSIRPDAVHIATEGPIGLAGRGG